MRTGYKTSSYRLPICWVENVNFSDLVKIPSIGFVTTYCSVRGNIQCLPGLCLAKEPLCCVLGECWQGTCWLPNWRMYLLLIFHLSPLSFSISCLYLMLKNKVSDNSACRNSFCSHRTICAFETMCVLGVGTVLLCSLCHCMLICSSIRKWKIVRIVFVSHCSWCTDIPAGL